MSEPRTLALRTLDFSRQLLDELGRHDSPVAIHYYFALLYHCSVVRNVEFAAGLREPTLLHRLIPEFYRLYVDSVVRRLRGDPGYRHTPLWDEYFRLTESLDHRRAWLGLPFLLWAGARAHIVGDLPQAIAAVGDREAIECVRADVFGPPSDRLYALVIEDFVRAIAQSPQPSLAPPAPASLRLAARLLRRPIIVGVQAWRRAALEQARGAMASTGSTLSPLPA